MPRRIPRAPPLGRRTRPHAQDHRARSSSSDVPDDSSSEVQQDDQLDEQHDKQSDVHDFQDEQSSDDRAQQGSVGSGQSDSEIGYEEGDVYHSRLIYCFH